MVPGPSENNGEIPPSSSRRQQPVGRKGEEESAPLPASSRQCSPPPWAPLLRPHNSASIPSLHPHLCIHRARLPMLVAPILGPHPHRTQAPIAEERQNRVSAGPSHPLRFSAPPPAPSRHAQRGRESRLCPAVSFSRQRPLAEPPGRAGWEQMGAQGKQAADPRVASSSWQPRPCRRQRAAPGGRQGPPRCGSICVSHRLAAPYLPPAASPLGAVRGRWHQSAGEPVPGLSSQARCGHARPAVPSVCSAPPDGGAGVSPGTAAPPAPAQIFIARVVRRLMGFTIFGIRHSQSWAPAGRRAGEPPSTQMNTGNPLPLSLVSLLLNSQGGRG